MINIINQLEDGNFKNKIIREVCLEIPFVLFRDENYSILHSHTHANCLLIEDTYYHVNNNFEVTGYSYACGNKSGEIELKEYKLLKRYGFDCYCKMEIKKHKSINKGLIIIMFILCIMAYGMGLIVGTK